MIDALPDGQAADTSHLIEPLPKPSLHTHERPPMKSSNSFPSIVIALLLLAGMPIAMPRSLVRQPVLPPQADPYAVLRTASKIFVQAKSDFMDREALERELLNRADFSEWGMVVTRNREDANLVVEITRKKFTTRFTIRLVDPRTSHVLAAEEASSLGGEIEPKLADRFVKLIKAARKQLLNEIERNQKREIEHG